MNKEDLGEFLNSLNQQRQNKGGEEQGNNGQNGGSDNMPEEAPPTAAPSEANSGIGTDDLDVNKDDESNLKKLDDKYKDVKDKYQAGKDTLNDIRNLRNRNKKPKTKKLNNFQKGGKNNKTKKPNKPPKAKKPLKSRSANKAGNQAKRQATKQAGKKAVKKGTKLGAKLGAKLAAKGGILAFFATPPGWIVLIVIVCLILIIGILSFFGIMGDMIIGIISGLLQGIWDGCETIFNGDQAEAKINTKQILEAAQYLDEMGYDLEGMGFFKTEYAGVAENKLWREGENYNKWYNENGELITEQKYWWKNKTKNDYIFRILEEDENGNVKIPAQGEPKGEIYKGAKRLTDNLALYSFPIQWYLVTALRSYINGTYGGMVVQDGYEGNYIWNCVLDNLAFDSGKHSVKVTASLGQKWKDFWHRDIDAVSLNVSLEDWTDKYGTSYEFLVCLHLGTLSPEFVLDLCGQGGTESAQVNYNNRTQVIISARHQGGELNVEYTDPSTGEVIDDLRGKFQSGTVNGVPIDTTVMDFFNKAGMVFTKKDGGGNIIAYLMNYPYIQRTVNHWYRDVIFVSEGNNNGRDDGTNINCYDVTQEKKVYLGNDSFKESKNFPSEYKLYLDFCDPDNNRVNGGLTQVRRPYYIDREPKIMKLIRENEYHVFKGTYNNKLVSKEDVPNMSESEKKEFASNLPYYTDKRKIKFLGSIKDGIQLLESVETVRAQYNLRDLKEILAYYNYVIEEETDENQGAEGEYSTATNKEENAEKIAYENWCRQWNNRVRGYVIMKSDNKTIKEIRQEEKNWGDYIPESYFDEINTSSLQINNYNTKQNDDNSLVILARSIGGTGFSEGEDVCSTVNGKIISKSENSIIIKSDGGTVLNISNISTNDELNVGDTVYIGTQIAKTTNENIKVTLKDKYHKTLNAEEYININVLINKYA